jgi:hypothetical protein
MLKPQFVTFTGIDEYTDAERVIDLSAQYPCEWGILFSKSNQGRGGRYPSLVAISKFLEADLWAKVKLSAHICGRYSNQIMLARGAPDPDLQDLIDLITYLSGQFARTQINVADGETLVNEQDVRPDRARIFSEAIAASGGAIIQCRGDFPNDPTVSWLYDRSGGRGETPASWSANAQDSAAFVGYAGGIGPNNVTAVLGRIAQVHPADKPFWIDMEGNVRTQDRLDLDKCEAVLKAVYG